ncbi:hypothetical protein ACFX15_004853 [Malus domestica]
MLGVNKIPRVTALNIKIAPSKTANANEVIKACPSCARMYKVFPGGWYSVSAKDICDHASFPLVKAKIPGSNRLERVTAKLKACAKLFIRVNPRPLEENLSESLFQASWA